MSAAIPCPHSRLVFVEKYECTSKVNPRPDGLGYEEDTLMAWADDFISQGFWFECEACGQRFLALEEHSGAFRPGTTVHLR